MRTQEFEYLIEDFCRLVGLPDAADIAQGGAIDVGGVVFSIIHNTNAAANRLFLYADFGAPPAERQAEVFAELLKHNFMHFAGKGPAFTLSPTSGHVVYVEHFMLDDTTPQELADAMAALSAVARDWQGTRFLSGPNMLRFGVSSAQAAHLA